MAMLLEKNYLEVKKLLAEHRVLLDKMTAEALSKTTLVLKDIQKIMNENTDRKGEKTTKPWTLY
jgi:cell division protease FtsH